MLNNKLRSLIFSCNISVVCNELYVVSNNESENKMKAINFVLVYCDKLTILSLICDTHEMNIQRQTRLSGGDGPCIHVRTSIDVRMAIIKAYFLVDKSSIT